MPYLTPSRTLHNQWAMINKLNRVMRTHLRINSHLGDRLDRLVARRREPMPARRMSLALEGTPVQAASNRSVRTTRRQEGLHTEEGTHNHHNQPDTRKLDNLQPDTVRMQAQCRRRLLDMVIRLSPPLSVDIKHPTRGTRHMERLPLWVEARAD